MIPTWIHGIVDYLAALLLGAIAATPSLDPGVRRVLGGAGAMHAGYSLVTDYEAGTVAFLTMREHLALDTLGAGAIAAAGALLPGATPRERALLVGIGLAELAIIALSDSQPVSGPGQRGGPVERLAERLEALQARTRAQG